MIDPSLRILAIALIALLFVAAAAGKLSHRGEFAEILRGYRLFPEVLIPVLRAAVPLVELATAALLLYRPEVGGALAAFVLLAYGAALASVALRGFELEDCGCGWGASDSGAKMWGLVVRNLLLAGIAALPVLAVAAHEPTGFEIINGIAGAFAAGTLWAGASALLANRRRMRDARHV